MTKVALLDYGMGNLHSAGKALAAVGADVAITNDPKIIASCDKILFPGVGAMRDCMAGMRETGIDEMVRRECGRRLFGDFTWRGTKIPT